jgi:hypothetical protein
VRDDSTLAHFILAHFLHEAEDGVECAAHFERADTLEVLAFEKQPDLRLCRFLAFPLRALECFGGLRGRCECGQGRVCEDGRAMDVWFDEGVGSHYGLTRQGTRRRICSHGVRCLVRDIVASLVLTTWDGSMTGRGEDGVSHVHSRYRRT